MSKNQTTTSAGTVNQTSGNIAGGTAGQDAAKSALGLTLGTINQPGYQGQLTAGLSPDQQAAFGLINNSGGVGQQALNNGVDAANIAAGYHPTQITPGAASVTSAAGGGAVSPSLIGNIPGVSGGGVGAGVGTAGAGQATTSNLPQTDLNPYLNPYNQDVIDASLRTINQQQGQADQKLAGTQAATGAFGDSRSGVQAALQSQLFDQNKQSTIAGLNQGNFANAQAQAQTDLARQAAVSQTNAGLTTNASIASANNALSAGTTNANLGYSASAANASNSLAAMMQNANNSLAAGTTNANLAQQNSQFNAGAANTGSQFNTSLAAQIAGENQAAGLSGNAQNLAAASTLGNLGMSQQQQVLNQANAQGAAGAVEQGTQQAGLTAQYQSYLQQQGYNAQQIAAILPMLQATYGTNTTQATTGSQTTPVNIGGALLGAAGTVLGGPIGGAIAGKIAGTKK